MSELHSDAHAGAWQELAGPPASDPESQLAYLKRMVQLFHRAPHPRVKALRRKLDAALIQLVEAAETGRSPAELAEELAGHIDALRSETFELLLTVVNQVRGTLRVRAKNSPAELQDGLQLFSQALRKMVAAMRKGDLCGETEAQRQLDEAASLLERQPS